MRGLPRSERRELAALFRALSPPAEEPRLPELGPELEALAAISLPRRPRAVLFDVYGTLARSAAGGEPGAGPSDSGLRPSPAAELLERELGVCGYRGGAGDFAAEFGSLAAEESARLRRGGGYAEIEAASIISRRLPALPARRARRLALLLEAALNPCSPMPGAAALLETLATEGLLLGLVSNAQFYTEPLLDALFGEELAERAFDPDLRLLSFELGEAKPGPLPFARAASILRSRGIAAAEVLALGNSAANDIAPAAAEGFMTALFAGDPLSFRPGPAAPDIALRRLAELPSRFPEP
jgi:putative hydrolase of the HAD superfamily